MPQNRNAGKHPSYKKRGMSEKSRQNKLKYDKEFQKNPKQVKKRVEANRANREAQRKGTGRVGDKMDASHTRSGRIVQESQKSNRARNGSGKGGKRKNTKK